MITFKHRCNDIEDLKKYKEVEIDIKASGKGELILGHNHNAHTCYFEDYLKACNGHRLAINIKQSGLCKPLIKLLKRYYMKTIKEFYFFDMAVPDLITDYLEICPEFTAFRLSEYENKLFDKAKYIWLDYFNWKQFNHLNYVYLSDQYKIIVASPELHSFKNTTYPKDKIKNFYGVCTKTPELYI